MGKEKRGIVHGRCTCTSCDCEEYEVIQPHHILCDYCGHPPMVHTKESSCPHDIDLGPSTSSPPKLSKNECSLQPPDSSPSNSSTFGKRKLDETDTPSTCSSATRQQEISEISTTLKNELAKITSDAMLFRESKKLKIKCTASFVATDVGSAQ